MCSLEHEPLEPNPNQEGKANATAGIVSTTANSDTSSTLSTAPSFNPVSHIESSSASDSLNSQTPTGSNEGEHQPNEGLKESKARNGANPETPGYNNGLVLVTVSGGGDFDAIKKWSDGVVKVFSPLFAFLK